MNEKRAKKKKKRGQMEEVKEGWKGNKIDGRKEERRREFVVWGRESGLKKEKEKRMRSCHLLAWIVSHINFTHRWKTCSRHSPRHTLNCTSAFSHVQTDMHALPLNTYTHILPILTTSVVLQCFSLHMTSIWGATAGCGNYCTSAPICLTLYKPRMGPAKVSAPKYNTW